MTALIVALAMVAQDAKAPKTPEAAFRTFVVAMMEKDEATLRAVTLPNEDLPWLLKGQPLSKAQLDALREQLAKMPIKSLKAGDSYTLPGNRKLTVAAEEVGDDRAVLLPQGSPIPTRCRKVGEVWRVDATPVIAGRKAAEAARNAAEKKAKESPKKP